MAFSRDNKTEHDDKPHEADDTSAEYYMSFVRKDASGVLSDAAANVAQARAIFGTIAAPSSVFAMTVQDNSLIAEVSPITPEHDEHVIIVDSSTAPTIGDGSWNLSGLAAQYVLQDFGPHTYYLWVNDGATVAQIPPGSNDPNNDGETVPGLNLRANDTVNPSAVLTLSSGTNTDTEIDWVIASSDSGSGIDSTQTTLFNADKQTVESVGNASGTIIGRNPGDTYNYYARVTDNHGNSFETATQSHTTSSAVGTTGTVNFTNASESFDEDDGTVTVDLVLTDRTDSDEKTVTVSKREWTTEGTSQVDAISSETVTFTVGSDPQTATVEFVLTDQSSLTNNMFELYIDDGSAAGDALGAPIIGTNNAILVLVNGTGTTSGNAYIDYLDTSRQLLVLDFDPTIDADWSYTVGDTTNDSIVSASISSADGAIANNVHWTTTLGGIFVNKDPFPTEPATTASSAQIAINLSATRNWYIWARGRATGSNYSTHFGIDENQVNVDQFARIINGATWDWRPVGTASGSTPTAYSMAAGDHTFYLATREAAASLYWDMILITDDASYTPSGIAQTRSAKATGEAAVDNPDNPALPLGPPTSTTATPVYSPVDNGTIQTNGTLTMTFAGLTGILLNTDQITVTNDGATANGSWTTDGINVATYTLDVGQNWTTAAAVTIEGTDIGTIISSGVRISITDLGSGDWNLTVSDKVSSDFIQFIDFTSITGTPRDVVSADILAPNGVFHSEGWDTNPTDNPDGVGEGNQLKFVSDPFSTGRGNVIEHFIKQGNGSHNWTGKTLSTRHYDIVNPVGGAAMDDVYAAIDIAVPSGYESPSSVHFGGIWQSPDRSTHAGTIPTDITPNKCRSGPNFYGLASGFNRGSNALALYVYRGGVGDGVYGPFYFNENPGETTWRYDSSQVGQVRIPTNQWFTIEWRMKLNTFSGTTPLRDGILQAWLNGVIVLDVQTVKFISEEHALKINMITHGLDYGGDQAIALNDDYIWIDNMRYSTFPITH